jgi:hypothetical protein
VVVDHAGEVVPERTVARADDPPADADTVRVDDRRGMVERRLQGVGLVMEMRVEREFLRHEERSYEDDARAAVGGQAAREVERVLGLVAAEERDDDRAGPSDHSTW